jgi:hypothetical protein
MFAFTGRIETHLDDGGQARIAEDLSCVSIDHPEIFVRLQSWHDADDWGDKGPRHPAMDELEGRKVMITIEILPE